MRSDRARRRSWRWFPVFYLSKLIPESSEFPVPLFWKAHPKTLRTSALGKSRNIQELLTDRIHRRYALWDPCDSKESVRKTKDLMSDVKAWDESARTQWVFISGLAFNQISDPLFFSDSGVEQGSRITYLRPILSRKFWIFSGISLFKFLSTNPKLIFFLLHLFF